MFNFILNYILYLSTQVVLLEDSFFEGEFMPEQFILFGEQHTQALTYSFLIIALLCVIGNFLNSKAQDVFAKLIGISLLVFEVTKPFIYIYGFDKPWETYLPLHMCNFSAVLIGIFLLQKNKNQLFFELPFYWGIGGATMALLTPDLTMGWPDIEFFMFFYGHGQIILGIFFALTVLKHRPYLQNFWKMAVITILLLIPILIVNLVIGGDANYWYLMNTPEGDSLMNFMPAPPYHMLGVAPLALIVFFITYLPFLVWDRAKKA